MPRLAPRPLYAAAPGLWLLTGCVRPGPADCPEPAPAVAPSEGVAEGDDRPATEEVPPDREATVELTHPGCFMLQTLDGGEPLVAGDQPCDEATIPASTFKVPHALIALDTGVVSDPEAMVKWDGREYWLDSWERDHNLRTAIYHSVVWFFQGTARAIGPERMTEYLQAFDYGNASVEPIDQFWLEKGSLRVTPAQTLRFWADLYRARLPKGAEHLPLLRALLVRPPSSFAGRMEDGTSVPQVSAQMIFSAKTGTGGHEKGAVFWMAGHVECPGREHVFVSRVIAPGRPRSKSPAVTHGLAALDRLGVLRCER